jgi:hypothetical protein
VPTMKGSRHGSRGGDFGVLPGTCEGAGGRKLPPSPNPREMAMRRRMKMKMKMRKSKR